MVIETSEQLDCWLAEHNGFDTAAVPRMTPAPEVEQRGGGSLIVAQPAEGSWEVNTVVRHAAWEIAASDVMEWALRRADYGTGDEHDPRFHGAGIWQVEVPSGVGFEIECGGTLRVIAGSFDVRPCADVRWLCLPWSSSECRCSVPLLPTPARWLEMMQTPGSDLTWRVLGGGPKSVDDVPTPYEGWFVEERERLGVSDGGLLMSIVRPGECGWDLTLDLGKAWSERPWLRRAALALAELADGTVDSGNVSFTPAQWREHVFNGHWPRALRDLPTDPWLD